MEYPIHMNLNGKIWVQTKKELQKIIVENSAALRNANPNWTIEQVQEKEFLELIGKPVNLYKVAIPTIWDAN